MEWQNSRKGICFFGAFICIGVVQIVNAHGVLAEPARILAIEDESSRTRALGDALKAHPADRQIEMLKEIFRLDTNGDATSAVVRLIRRSAADASTLDLAAQRLSGWSPGFQLNLLNNMYDYRTFYHLRGDAVDHYQRLLLAAHASALAPPLPDATDEYLRYRRTALCYSLAMLGELPDSPAAERAHDTLRIAPDINAAWIVLIQRGAIDEDAANLARQLLADDVRPLPIRYLAAVALAPTDPEARRFTLDTVNAAIAEHGGLTMREMLLPHLKLPSGHPDRDHYFRFEREVLPVISYIQLLNPEDSEALLRQCAAVRHEQISGWAHVMIAIRFPGITLEDPPLLDDAEAMLNFAAYAAEEHPRLLPLLEARYGAAALGAAIESVRSRSIIDWRIRPWPLPNCLGQPK